MEEADGRENRDGRTCLFKGGNVVCASSTERRLCICVFLLSEGCFGHSFVGGSVVV